MNDTHSPIHELIDNCSASDRTVLASRLSYEALQLNPFLFTAMDTFCASAEVSDLLSVPITSRRNRSTLGDATNVSSAEK